MLCLFSLYCFYYLPVSFITTYHGGKNLLFRAQTTSHLLSAVHYVCTLSPPSADYPADYMTASPCWPWECWNLTTWPQIFWFSDPHHTLSGLKYTTLRIKAPLFRLRHLHILFYSWSDMHIINIITPAINIVFLWLYVQHTTVRYVDELTVTTVATIVWTCCSQNLLQVKQIICKWHLSSLFYKSLINFSFFTWKRLFLCVILLPLWPTWLTLILTVLSLFWLGVKRAISFRERLHWGGLTWERSCLIFPSCKKQSFFRRM